jgi:hypothetical protein
MDRTFLQKISKRKKIETNLKNNIYINNLIIKNRIRNLMDKVIKENQYNQQLIHNFKTKDHIIFNIVNIPCLLEILKICINEQIELHVDTILEYFPNIDIDNFESSKIQNVNNFIKCFNSVNKLPSNRFGYKIHNKALDINRYQIQCSPQKINNVKYIICEVFGDKIIFETWRLYLDKYI